MVLPEGWTKNTEQFGGNMHWVFTHTDGTKLMENPEKPEGIIALANAITDMRAILSVNLLENDIGIDQARALASILKEHPTLKSLCGNTGDETKLDMSSKMRGADDAIMLAAEIIGNGALTSLNVSNNSIISDSSNVDKTNELKNGELVEYDGVMCPVSAQWGTGYRVYLMHGVVALADAIKDMGAMTRLDISKNHLRANGCKALAEALAGNQVMQELNVADNQLALKADAQTESDVDISGVTTLADVISGMGALTKLIFGGDAYYDEQRKWVTPEPATLEVGMTEADFSNKNLGASGAMIISAWLSHKDNGALTKLDISNNNIGAEQKGGLQRSCVASGIELAT
jgi:hypothetical protein